MQAISCIGKPLAGVRFQSEFPLIAMRVAIIGDNTAASVASVKPMREGLLKELGLELVMDEIFMPPLSDATPLVQKMLVSARSVVLSS